MTARGRFPEVHSISYDWDPNVKPPSDEDVEEYRAVSMQNHVFHTMTPWDELSEGHKEIWRHRYKHGE